MSQLRYFVEKEEIQFFGIGEEATDPRPADFILLHTSNWSSNLIHLGQKLRYHGKDSKYTVWNHAAIIINTNGDIIQALNSGVRRGNLSEYKGTDYHLVRIKASREDRLEAVCFAEYALGEKYGTLTIVSIALSFLTGLKFSFGFDGQQICSGLVARALERTKAIFGSEPSHITPADLAKYYQVKPTVTE